MKIIKAVLRPDRLRQTPEHFSWVDQALVQHHWIDRCDNRMAALYLLLITVADAQGLSYYGGATLAARLHLSAQELTLTRQRLIDLDLIAYQAPLYQVLALPSTPASRPPQPGAASTATPAPTPARVTHTGPLSLAQLIDLECRHARL